MGRRRSSLYFLDFFGDFRDGVLPGRATAALVGDPEGDQEEKEDEGDANADAYHSPQMEPKDDCFLREIVTRHRCPFLCLLGGKRSSAVARDCDPDMEMQHVWNHNKWGRKKNQILGTKSMRKGVEKSKFWIKIKSWKNLVAVMLRRGAEEVEI